MKVAAGQDVELELEEGALLLEDLAAQRPDGAGHERLQAAAAGASVAPAAPWTFG